MQYVIFMINGTVTEEKLNDSFIQHLCNSFLAAVYMQFIVDVFEVCACGIK